MAITNLTTHSDPDAETPGTVVTLSKGADRWRFSCTLRDAEALLRSIDALANDPACPLDPFDAAVLRREITLALQRHDAAPSTPAVLPDHPSNS